MVNKKDNAKFMPTVAIPPGKTIRENMKYLGMNQKELALRLGITTKHLSNVINGNDPITYETALKLETVLGPKAQFWMNLETNYQLTKARLKREADLEADLEILKGVPYKSMSDFGWVPATDNRQERINNLRGFFGVASLKAVPKTMNAMLRKHKQIKGISDLGVMAWLRKAEIDGLVVKVKKFNRTKLKKYIPKFRELTLKSPEEFLPKVQKLCAECGVALVLVPSLPKTYICGKGYHVVLPLKPSVSWDAFYDFAKGVAEVMVQKWPDRYTSNVRKAKRAGKIFVDWMRNGRGATSIAPYSIRARKGASVSMPIAWDELDTIAPDGIKMNDSLLRVRGDDPWKDIFQNNQLLKSY
jgi:addiction module HigA family antidote